MKPLRHTFLALTATILAATSAHAQVISQVPASAQMVIRVKNLQAVSNKVGTFIKDIGLGDQLPPPVAADPLGAMLQQGKITQGLNKDGDAAVVFMNLAGMNGTTPPSMVLLLPVSDYDAFIKNFADAKADGALSTFTMGSDTTPSYGAHWGNYAAISPVKDLVAASPAMMTASPSITALSDKDVLIWYNMKSLRDMMLPQIDQVEQMANQQIGTMTAGPAAKYAGVAKVAARQLFGMVRGFITQCDSASTSFNLADGGVAIDTQADFAADSYIGKIVSQLPKSDTSLMAGLPDAKYMMVGGMKLDPKLTSQLLVDAFGPIKTEMAGNADFKSINDYMESAGDIVAATKGNAFGWVVPTADLGTAPIMQTVSVIRGDAHTILESTHRAMDSVKGLLDATGNNMVKQTYSPAAKTLDGVTFDQVHTAFDAAGATTPQQQQASMFMPYLYGPDGVNTYMGQISDQSVLAIGGAPDALISQAIASAKSDSDAVSQQAGIVATSAHLAKGRFVEAYIPLDTILNTIGGYVGKMGIPVNITVPASDPIGYAIHADGSALVGESFIPTKLIAGVTTAVKAVMPKAAPAPAMTPAPGGGL